jgi:hypothetical protein
MAQDYYRSSDTESLLDPAQHALCPNELHEQSTFPNGIQPTRSRASLEDAAQVSALGRSPFVRLDRRGPREPCVRTFRAATQVERLDEKIEASGPLQQLREYCGSGTRGP